MTLTYCGSFTKHNCCSNWHFSDLLLSIS